ncbi:hypothetical protein DDN11_12880 [Vibrio cholerae]|nr:hypothetical protein [Vibrio cholerae]
MAAFGGYPQNVTFSTVNVAKGGGSENLLINPRGKINQLNEPDGVLSAGVYFCDGWKAGAGGAEVYRDPDGFRLISGSIVQLVPNNLGAGRNLRANMDVISGSPVMSINGGSDNVVSSDSEYISLEISGDNSKFTRTILAESLEIPIYQQMQDELSPCKKFLIVDDTFFYTRFISAGNCNDNYRYETLMHQTPAVQITSPNGAAVYSQDASLFSKRGFLLFSSSPAYTSKIIADARP